MRRFPFIVVAVCATASFAVLPAAQARTTDIKVQVVDVSQSTPSGDVLSQNETPIDAEKGATLMKLLATLEEDDDVQNVYSNFDMSDEDAAKLGV